MNWHRHHHHHHNEPTSALYLIGAPDPVIARAEMKKHLRIDDADNEDMVDAVTAAATQYLDGRDGLLGRALGEQTWELKLSWFPGCGFIDIPLPPLIEVVSIKYLDTSLVEQTFDAANYMVAGETSSGRVFLKSGRSWPSIGTSPEAVTVQFTAGYEDGVPAPINAAIKLLASSLYENRESIVIGQTATELPWACEALLRPYRVFSS